MSVMRRDLDSGGYAIMSSSWDHREFDRRGTRRCWRSSDWRVASHLGNGETWDEPAVLERFIAGAILALSGGTGNVSRGWFTGGIAAVVLDPVLQRVQGSGLSGAWFIVVATARAWQGRGIGSRRPKLVAGRSNPCRRAKPSRSRGLPGDQRRVREVPEYARFVPRHRRGSGKPAAMQDLQRSRTLRQAEGRNLPRGPWFHYTSGGVQTPGGDARGGAPERRPLRRGARARPVDEGSRKRPGLEHGSKPPKGWLEPGTLRPVVRSASGQPFTRSRTTGTRCCSARRSRGPPDRQDGQGSGWNHREAQVAGASAVVDDGIYCKLVADRREKGLLVDPQREGSKGGGDRREGD